MTSVIDAIDKLFLELMYGAEDVIRVPEYALVGTKLDMPKYRMCAIGIQCDNDFIVHVVKPYDGNELIFIGTKPLMVEELRCALVHDGHDWEVRSLN